MRRARSGGTRRLPGTPGEGLANAEDDSSLGTARPGAIRGGASSGRHTACHGHPLRIRGLRGGDQPTTGRHPAFGLRRILTGPGRHRPQTTAGPAADPRPASRRSSSRWNAGPAAPADQWQTSPSSCRRARRRSTGRCAGSRRRDFRAAPSGGRGPLGTVPSLIAHWINGSSFRCVSMTAALFPCLLLISWQIWFFDRPGEVEGGVGRVPAGHRVASGARRRPADVVGPGLVGDLEPVAVRAARVLERRAEDLDERARALRTPRASASAPRCRSPGAPRSTRAPGRRSRRR